MEKKFEYDVAISYQSDLEDKVTRLVDYLKQESLNVFFAPDRQEEMMSGKLHGVLYDVYKNQSLVKVLLVTEKYLQGEWTSLEMRMSLNSTDGDRRRLIIVNYMGEALPDELKVFVYLDGNKLFEDQLAAAIAQRTRALKGRADEGMRGQRANQKAGYDTMHSDVHVQNYGIQTGANAVFNNTQIYR